MNTHPDPAQFLPTVEIKKYIIPVFYKKTLYNIAIEQAHDWDGTIHPYWTISQSGRLSAFSRVFFKFKTAEEAFLYICNTPNVTIQVGKNPLPLPQSQSQPVYYEPTTPHHLDNAPR